MSDLIAHLWSSTLVLVAALVLAHILPLTARTRYAVLFFGLLKFAIPSAIFTTPLRALGANQQGAGSIVVEWVGGPAPLRAIEPPPASVWPSALIAAWVISAFALAVAWAVARKRLVHSALKAAAPASSREQAALAAARRRMNLRTGIDVTRSTICEAPAVVRIIRPVVVLPDGGCDALDDDELESLLRHECAHVARRDNFLGVIESAIVAAFWFHPLVWIAQRSIATAREEACDETAAATSDAVDTYVSALTKICRSVLAARLAGVSCMASAHLKERLEHLMSYELLRRRALSHHFVVTFAAIAILAVTLVSGLDAAATTDSTGAPFSLTFSVRPGDLPNQIEFTGRVSETKNGLMLTRPSVAFQRGTEAHVITAAGDREVRIDIRDSGEKVVAVLRVFEGGALRQETTHSAVLEPDGARNAGGRRYTGDKITLDLKDARLQDVLATFGKLTGLEIRIPQKYADERVNLDIKDMPWDQAFDLILRENRLTWKMEGKTVIILPE